jgi:hypothetical protein
MHQARAKNAHSKCRICYHDGEKFNYFDEPPNKRLNWAPVEHCLAEEEEKEGGSRRSRGRGRSRSRGRKRQWQPEILLVWSSRLIVTHLPQSLTF